MLNFMACVKVNKRLMSNSYLVSSAVMIFRAWMHKFEARFSSVEHIDSMELDDISSLKIP